MIYFAKFDNNGERIEIYAADDMPYSYEKLQEMEGFVELSSDDFELYCTNDYIRDIKTGKPIPRPPYVPTVQEVANQTWQTIKTARDTTEQAGCPYMDKVLDSDVTSVQRISIAVQAAQQAIATKVDNFTLDWTMQDNSVIAMSAEDVIGMSAALAAYSNSLHARARLLRDQIEQIVTDFEAGTMKEDTARSALSGIKFDGDKR